MPFTLWFTGIEGEYEPPLAPEITVDTGSQTINECFASIMKQLSLYIKIPSRKKDEIKERFKKRGQI